MKRILYFSPIDWGWIKQRPQFLAEYLSQYNEITVIYPFRNKRFDLQQENHSVINTIPYYMIPSFFIGLLHANRLQEWFVKKQILHAVDITSYDYVWLSMPWQWNFISDVMQKMPIIYDCMDDYLSINPNKKYNRLLAIQEKEIIKHATMIFASSDNLKTKLVSRYDISMPRSIHTVRNGYDSEWVFNKYQQKEKNEDKYSIGYFGTIGRWFDFDAILYSLSKEHDIVYHLYGPLESGIYIPKHDRIIFHGVIEHRDIPKILANVDALIMPFVNNEIVNSVDPVKLYEYIFLNKNILSVHYPEIDRFNKFVHFYSTKYEMVKQIEKLKNMSCCSYSISLGNKFLMENSWKIRAFQINNLINNISNQ